MIRWRIAVPFVVLILVAMIGLSLYLYHSQREAYMQSLEAQLSAEARLLADALALPLSQAASDALSGTPHPSETGSPLDIAAKRYAELLGARVTIIGADGTVLGESHEDRTRMDNHSNRPEVRAALAAGEGIAIRFSRTLDTDMMYLAARASLQGQVAGVVRVALPLRQIRTNLARIGAVQFAATATAAFLAVLLALWIAERTTRPIHQLTRAVMRMAAGDLGARVLTMAPADTRRPDEIGSLTRAFNEMARQIETKVTTTMRERQRLTAVLAHMADGVVITDGDGHVSLINPAAARLLDTTEQEALARPVAQVMRHHQLIELWRRCQETGEQQTQTVEIGRRLFLQAIATPLHQPHAQSCLIILQDLTQIQRLRTMRRDFISNISHELRTPLASLKAMVDTLKDGALADPSAAERFLQWIEAEVDAMTQLVEELLELSRIESGQTPLRLHPVAVAEIVLPPVERLRPQAERAGLHVKVKLPEDLPLVSADVERARQVVTNLIHNAIKFTPEGEITVSAWSSAGEVIISVQDTGVGISEEDLPRVFERFYKADRARAGGGTGLGLAIAKHIVQAHGGRIWAESREGAGSTFYFSLGSAASALEQPDKPD